MDKIFLNRVLDLLSSEERQIVILNSVLGLKHREIADILELPLSTAMSKYYRALSKLKVLVEEEAK